jgi:hypothetical protein
VRRVLEFSVWLTLFDGKKVVISVRGAILNVRSIPRAPLFIKTYTIVTNGIFVAIVPIPGRRSVHGTFISCLAAPPC